MAVGKTHRRAQSEGIFKIIMPKIASVEWAKITVDNQEYAQVLVVENEVIERDSNTLHRLFGTTHKMSDLEIEKLLGGKPEIIVIGNGWEGAMEVSQKFKIKLKVLSKYYPHLLPEFKKSKFQNFDYLGQVGVDFEKAAERFKIPVSGAYTHQQESYA